MGINASFEQFGTTVVNTLSPLFNKPKTGVFPAAPLPFLPLTLLAAKYDSSSSKSPTSFFVSFILSLKIFFLIILK